jgi:hypothetical protein
MQPTTNRSLTESTTTAPGAQTSVSFSRKSRRVFRALNSRPSRPLSSWCRFRITADQDKWLCEQAQEAGVQTSALARHLIFQAPLPRRTLPKVNADALAALNRVGNNLNQAVALVHSRRLPVELLPVLEELLARLLEVRSTVVGVSENGGHP